MVTEGVQHVDRFFAHAALCTVQSPAVRVCPFSLSVLGSATISEQGFGGS